MTHKIKYLLIAGMLMALGCTDHFDELDRPTTTSEVIEPHSLFTRSLVTGSGLSAGVWQWMHQISGSVYAQHFSNIQVGANFTSDNYEPRAWNVPWNWYFASSGFAPMMYVHHVKLLSQELENPVQLAMARIWNVYLIQQVTDMYGDMPVSQAFQATRPQFDAQRDIYLFMLSELENSVRLINESHQIFQGFGQADVLYRGNYDNWIRFANTMTLRLALRASNTGEFQAQILPYLQNLNVDMTLSSNNHNAFVVPDPGGPTYHVQNPLTFVANWNEVRLSQTIVDILNQLDDPRLQVFGRPNAGGEYVGLPNGLPHSTIGEIRDTELIPNYSNIGTFFTQPNSPLYLLTYAEASFMKAEAAHRGFISGSAEEFYNQGIKASFNQLGIDSVELINAYLAGPAQFDAANALEQIWTQRWLALYPNGHEAWSVVRRTGVPQMRQPVFTYPGNDDMPRRKPYSDTEREYNAENYQQAVARMGGDSQYTRLWWDGGN